MKLMHPLFSNPIAFRENCIPVLVLENPLALRKLTAELIRQSECGEGQFVLSQRDMPLDCASHLNVLLDFIHVETVDKRIQTKAINSLLRSAQEMLTQETCRFTLILQEYLGKLANLAEFPVDYDHSENLSALLKAMDFRIDLGGMPSCEALYEQLALLHRLSKDQCFVLVNAKSFFSSEELAQLYQMTQYLKMHLLMLESHTSNPIHPFENVILFDADLCELHLDSTDEIG